MDALLSRTMFHANQIGPFEMVLWGKTRGASFPQTAACGCFCSDAVSVPNLFPSLSFWTSVGLYSRFTDFADFGCSTLALSAD
jgi:hypothetical protein